MHDAEPNQARRVRSADAAVFKAVEHEAALEREAELKARREAQRSAEAVAQPRQVPLRWVCISAVRSLVHISL